MPDQSPLVAQIAGWMPTVLAVTIAAALSAAGVWDALVFTGAIAGDSVSEVVTGWGRRAPSLVLALGILIGHLFFPAGAPPAGKLP